MTVDGAEDARMSGAERDIEEMAYLLFRAYRAQVTPTSTPPAWSELNEDTRAGWRAAAAFVIATGGDKPKSAADRDRPFARAFLALHFDLESDVAKSGVEILCRALEQAREQGRREQLKRDFG